MTQFQDLPDEIVVKVLSHLKVKDLLYCGQVSKRIRAVSHDKSLYQKIDLAGKKVQTIFLETIINKGCKELSLSGAQLEGSEFNLIEKSELRCLNLDFCAASVTNLEILTGSCVKLQKISMRKLTKLFLSSNMIKNICSQNGQTLQVLNLENCIKGRSLSTDQVQLITEKCVDLKELNFNKTGLFYGGVDILTNNLTPLVQKVSLQGCPLVEDWDIGVLVKRCNQISYLDLKDTAITNNCIPEIIKNLKNSLEELNVQTCHSHFILHENSAELFGLKFLTRFKILDVAVCGFMEKRLRYQLPGIVINNKENDGYFCC